MWAAPDVSTRYTPTRKDRNKHRKYLRNLYAEQLREERRAKGMGLGLWALGISLSVVAILIAVWVATIWAAQPGGL